MKKSINWEWVTIEEWGPDETFEVGRLMEAVTRYQNHGAKVYYHIIDISDGECSALVIYNEPFTEEEAEELWRKAGE